MLCARAALAAHPFDRFLKHYHQLELLVDWYIVQRMTRLPPNLNGLNKLMSSYAATDLEKIKSLLNEFCENHQDIKLALDAVSHHWDVATEVFQDFGKDKNPYKEISQWAAVKVNGVTIGQATTVAAYWLFRVRCSIAHHRAGEYLMKESDQDFVVEFAEPLLLEVIRQVLSNEKLQRLAV